ncbi:GNAT family N-acetyltransferase [Luteococcus peritonei]|uniref:GNAT family N-acetyltransferase n=1 Tax=Luteococcus peritonei TaxID=88874 RepID=A0ABW4RW85_9ACTN
MTLGALTVRPAVPADAEAYTHCYIECLAETYAHIMPPAFAQIRRDRFAQEATETREELVEMEQALAADRVPKRSHWLATDGDQVVGIVSAGPGVAAWEREHFTNPEPPVELNLDHIYTRRSTHGTGLGQVLLDLALADPHDPGRQRGAWLWILRQNPRAEAFYRRNGFVEEGLEVSCGASWFHAPMFRMWRPEPAA